MTDPKHIDAVARAILNRRGMLPLRPDEGSVILEARVEAKAVLDSDDPAVHAAMLDALTRHGVLTAEWAYDEGGIHWTGIDEKATRTDAAEVNAAVERRLVTAWEVAP